MIFCISMVFSTMLFLFLRFFIPESFIQTQWLLFLNKTYTHCNIMDYLKLHLEEILLFNTHVTPLIMNIFLDMFEPTHIEKNVSFHDAQFDSIYYLASINALCYMFFYFTSFRKKRDSNNPFDTRDLYKTQGHWDAIKRYIFIICFVVNTILVPASAAIWMCIILPRQPLKDNLYSEWMFTYTFMTFVPVFSMFKNFQS